MTADELDSLLDEVRLFQSTHESVFGKAGPLTMAERLAAAFPAALDAARQDERARCLAAASQRIIERGAARGDMPPWTEAHEEANRIIARIRALAPPKGADDGR